MALPSEKSTGSLSLAIPQPMPITPENPSAKQVVPCDCDYCVNYDPTAPVSLSLRVPQPMPFSPKIHIKECNDPRAIAAKEAVMEFYHLQKCDCDYCFGNPGYRDYGGLVECIRETYPYDGWPNRANWDDRPCAFYEKDNELYRKIQIIAMNAWDKCDRDLLAKP